MREWKSKTFVGQKWVVFLERELNEFEKEGFSVWKVEFISHPGEKVVILGYKDLP